MSTNESLLQRDVFTISDSYGTRSRRTGSIECLRVIFCGLNVLYMIFGLILTAIGIWIIVDRTFLYPVLNQVLIILAPSLMLAGGAFGFIVCLIGFIGASYRKENFLLFYVAASVIVILLLFVAAVLAIMLMLQAWNEEHMRLSMRYNLQEYYGVNLDKSFNRRLTDGWDRTQSMLMCCSVEDLSWDVYQKSHWYEGQPGVPRTGIFVPGSEYKRYVPKSCCVTYVEGSFIDGTTRSDGNYVDLDTCQTNPYGPPRDQTGLDNKALYYRGCYTAAIHYLRQIQVPVLIGLTAGMATLMIIGPILAVCLFKRLHSRPAAK